MKKTYLILIALLFTSIVKEFNNRWFLIGKRAGARGISNLALDRIINIDYDFKLSFFETDFDPDQFYKNVIGVTVNQGERPTPVKLLINAYNAPYVITKPLHHSQILEEQNDNGSIIVSIKVKINFELERLLLGFGESLEVLQPERLRKRISERLEKGSKLYL